MMSVTQEICLNCLILGEDLTRSFKVKTPRTADVDDLKKLIKQERAITYADIDAVLLDLYRVSLGTAEENNLVSVPENLLQNPLALLLDVFTSIPLGRIHVLVSRPPITPLIVDTKLHLHCLVFGEDLTRSFKVETARTADVGDLKELIKQKRAVTYADIDAALLDLYRVSLDSPEESDLVPVPDNLLQNPLVLLSDVFTSLPPGRIHALVSRPPPADVRTTPVQVRGEVNILTALSECKKSLTSYELFIDAAQTAFKRTTTITPKSLTPSQAAKSSEYMKIQSGDQRLLDCRCTASNPVDTVAPPIQLYNPAFAYFSSKAFDPEYNVPDDFMRDIRDLVAQFALIHTNEDTRRHHLKSILQRVIDHPLTFISNSDRTAPDVVALSSSGELSVYLIIGEEKNEFGDGASDPSVQASFSFLRTFSQKESSNLRLRCNCPAFIIAHAGPWLTIMGGIITAHCIVQRLTDFLWIPTHSTHDNNQYLRIARVLYALRESIQLLDSWYKAINDVNPFNPSVPASHPRFFPSPDTYWYDNAMVKFAYQEPLERNIACVTYLARTIGDSPKDVVVKFVTSYGADAHRKMALIGFAPQLLYYGPINVTANMPSYGSLHMVVMEYLKGLTLEDALKRGEVPSGFQADLRQAFEQLHAAGYVFGDLRPPNVIITPDRTSVVQLIDFDWAGKEGEVNYPVSISGSIDWPAGVEGLASIRKEHDLAMLNSLISHLP